MFLFNDNFLTDGMVTV